ncbi:heme ABC transporter permease [Salmonella enterica subsp. salamae]|uniref:Heme ABC transporter permease n=1 Tax=Salmonella enterica subsp. salamae TaxID=59202 RepID=A0A6D2G1N0_SALER|nr:heme ABC transporter permease [Salmonella enterica subsp. salamae]
MWRVFCLELRVAFRHGADIAGPLWFFLMVITLFPLSIGPQPQLLARIAPGIIQVGGAAGLAAGAGAAVPRRPAGRQPGAADAAAAAAAGGGAGEGCWPTGR